MAQRSSRKRRKQRQRSRAEPEAAAPGAPAALEHGYSRSRQRDEEARARLEPLAPGERPRAVTVGALMALGLALAEVVAAAIGFDPEEAEKLGRSAVVVPLLLLIAWGMWRAKYWAVLGMQTLLALTIVFAALAAIRAQNLNAVILVISILLPATTLFWFLVKAMARIQMPPRPGSQTR